ncbi:hypothetical protein [Rhodopila sp.]|uniref:hypothetical protein n=1 Tax=Rhodopila sp. TaxID=2480087 RepID=UPI003D0BC469
MADGTVIGLLRAKGVRAVAARLPLTSLADDVAALGRSLEHVEGAAVLAAVQSPIAIRCIGLKVGVPRRRDLPAGVCWRRKTA